MRNPGAIAFQANSWVKEHIYHKIKVTNTPNRNNFITSALHVIKGPAEKITTYCTSPVPGIYQNDPKTGNWFLIAVRSNKHIEGSIFTGINTPPSLLRIKTIEKNPKFCSKNQEIDPFDVYQIDGFRRLRRPIHVEYVKVLGRWMFSAEIKYRTKKCSVEVRPDQIADSPHHLEEHEFFCLDDAWSWVRRYDSKDYERNGPHRLYTLNEKNGLIRRQIPSEIPLSIRNCNKNEGRLYLSASVGHNSIEVMDTTKVMQQHLLNQFNKDGRY